MADIASNRANFGLAQEPLQPATDFRKIPNEIILQIFKSLSYQDLSTVEQVCKLWKILAQAAWHGIREFNSSKIFTFRRTCLSLTHFIYIMSFILEKKLNGAAVNSFYLNVQRDLVVPEPARWFVVEFFNVLFKSCPSLKKLELHNLHMRGEARRQSWPECQSLEELILVDCYFTMEVIEKIFKSPNQLQHIHIQSSEYCNDELDKMNICRLLENPAINFSKLKKLFLNIKLHEQEVVNTITRLAGQLTHLTLQNQNLFSIQMNERIFNSILTHQSANLQYFSCPLDFKTANMNLRGLTHITHLDLTRSESYLTNTTNYGDDEISMLLNSSLTLTHLNLARSHNITSAAFTKLHLNSPLTYLNLNGISDTSDTSDILDALRYNLAETLKELIMGRCYTALRENIIDFIDEMTKKNLILLDMTGTSFLNSNLAFLIQVQALLEPGTKFCLRCDDLRASDEIENWIKEQRIDQRTIKCVTNDKKHLEIRFNKFKLLFEDPQHAEWLSQIDDSTQPNNSDSDTGSYV
jgi:hypothetical protein